MRHTSFRTICRYAAASISLMTLLVVAPGASTHGPDRGASMVTAHGFDWNG